MTPSLQSLLDKNPEGHVWVSEYSITHGRVMHLVIHGGTVLHRTEIEARNCSYFRGLLQGGPYQLAVEQLARDTDRGRQAPFVYRLFDRGGELELICSELITGKETLGGYTAHDPTSARGSSASAESISSKER